MTKDLDYRGYRPYRHSLLSLDDFTSSHLGVQEVINTPIVYKEGRLRRIKGNSIVTTENGTSFRR